MAFATDYDGTLAHDGRVDESAIASLEKLKGAGRKLLMVTGRELPDLQAVFPRLDLFDVVVAENGSLLYFPESREERLVAQAPPFELVDVLRQRGVDPLSVGKGIIATWEPNEATVLEAIRDLGLDWQIIFNKGAVMVLPPGVNKATGLKAALDALGLSPLNVVAIGDAENDHAFLTASGASVAVANALDAVKATADLVTLGDHGDGVAEAVEALLAESSNLQTSAAARRAIQVGTADRERVIRADRGHVLIAGSSGIGKSTLATALVEKLTAQGFQILMIDPEGDYDAFQPAVVLGKADRAPAVPEVMSALANPDALPLVVNLLGIKVDDRPAYFRDLAGAVRDLQERTARPHWVLVDEAHHLLPARLADGDALAPPPGPAIFVTVHPDQMSPAVLESVNTVLAVGPQARDVVRAFCEAVGVKPPRIPKPTREDAVLFWDRLVGPPRWIEADRPEQDLKRHVRKYAQGELGEDKSFYFRGPDNALNLRAQNLMVFLQLADGVDDATWLHHLHRGDYAEWFRTAIKDDDLATEAQAVQDNQDPAATRRLMREVIERRYTAPARS